MADPLTPTEAVARLVNDNDSNITRALGASETQSMLFPVASTAKGNPGEYLPAEEYFSDANAPVVVIVVKADADAAPRIAALLKRYRGEDPAATAKKHWFW